MKTKKGMMKMKSVVASLRFVVGDVVSWKSKNGNQYTGTVVNIKEGSRESASLFSHDDLIVVCLANGQYRSFYDNATDWWIEA